MFPVLHQLLGQTLITTDGKTLLGADDKAGVAEIMTALAVLKGNPIPHGDIKVAFTPDEEVGKGAKHFDVEAFGAQWAYTVDGGGVGELEFENFNAASVNIKIVGNNVHPGTAKGVMVNALSLAARIHAEVPADEAPETTEGYEGFYHLASMKGTVDRAEMHYIIRDFDRKQFEARKRKMMSKEVFFTFWYGVIQSRIFPCSPQNVSGSLIDCLYLVSYCSGFIRQRSAMLAGMACLCVWLMLLFSL